MASFVPTEKPQIKYMTNITDSIKDGYSGLWKAHPNPQRYGDITYIDRDGKISYFHTSDKQLLEDPSKFGPPTEGVNSSYIDRSTYNEEEEENEEENTIVPRQSFDEKNNQGSGFKSNLVVEILNKAFDRVDTKFINNSKIAGINKISNKYKRFGKFLIDYGIEKINITRERHNNRKPTHIMYGFKMSHNAVGARDHGKLFSAYTKPFDVSKFVFSRKFVAYCLPIVLALLMNLNPSNFLVCFIYFDTEVSKRYIVTEYDHSMAEISEKFFNDRVYYGNAFEKRIRELGDITLSNGITITTDFLFSYFFHKIAQVRMRENMISSIDVDFYNDFWVELNDLHQTLGGGKKYRKISKTKRKKQRSKRRSQKKSNRSIKHRQ